VYCNVIEQASGLSEVAVHVLRSPVWKEVVHAGGDGTSGWGCLQHKLIRGSSWCNRCATMLATRASLVHSSNTYLCATIVTADAHVHGAC
jgi:hypothetical protein